MDMTTIVVAASIPSAFTGFCFWLIEQNLKKRADNEKEEREERQKQLDEREQIREKNELCIINSVNAAIALGEATARAVQRIPDAHCNGDIYTTGKSVHLYMIEVKCIANMNIRVINNVSIVISGQGIQYIVPGF